MDLLGPMDLREQTVLLERHPQSLDLPDPQEQEEDRDQPVLLGLAEELALLDQLEPEVVRVLQAQLEQAEAQEEQVLPDQREPVEELVLQAQPEPAVREPTNL